MKRNSWLAAIDMEVMLNLVEYVTKYWLEIKNVFTNVVYIEPRHGQVIIYSVKWRVKLLIHPKLKRLYRSSVEKDK